jgi:Spy/CpxP family protein refolding chaperone
MNQPWKVILVLVGIFAAGGLTGSFVTQKFFRGKISHRPAPEQWAPRHLQRLVGRLDLTPEQQEEIRPIVRRHMEQLRQVRSESVAASRKVFETMQREIGEKLTPEQRVKFEQMNRDTRERVKKMHSERGDGAPAPKALPARTE